MQIEKVRIKNLNSLVGEWEIDFNVPEYQSEGIFAITGPTGSGKSTILDAISLALFGRTPRLSTVSKSENELMSRHAAECLAEVEFRTEEGRFRSSWFQHRSRKKADGALQAPEREFSDALSGKILESKATKVSEIVKEKLGQLDYDQFTRSMLLAQGEFNRFLSASPGERSPILERITGTEIYSTISKAVFERQKIEKNKLAELRVGLSGFQLLSPEEESKLQKSLSRSKEQDQVFQQELDALSQQIQSKVRIQQLQEELRKHREEIEERDREEKIFQPETAKLERSRKANTLSSEYTILEELRKNRERNSKELKEKREIHPQIEEQFRTGENSLNLALEKYAAMERELEKMRPIFRKAREWDLSMDSMKKELESVSRQLDENWGGIKSTNTNLTQYRLEKERIDRELEDIKKYFADHHSDGALTSHLSGFREKIAAFFTGKKEFDRKRKNLEDQEEKLRNLGEILNISGSDANLDIATGLEDLRSEKSELEKHREQLRDESEFLIRVQSLEKHRRELHEGTPCPLCGALEHPYAEEKVPDLNKNKLAIQELDRKLKQIDRDISQREEFLPVEREFHRLHEDFQIAQERISADLHELIGVFTPFAVFDHPDPLSPDIFEETERLEKFFENVLHDLSKRRELWSEKQNRSEKLQIRKTEISTKILSATENLGKLESTLGQLEEKSKNLRLEIEEQVISRREIFTDRDPVQEEKRREEELSLTKNSLENLRKACNQQKERRLVLETQLKTLERSILETERELEKQQSGLLKKFSESGFRDETDYLSARLSPQHENQLREKAMEMQRERTRIQGLIVDKNEDLLQEQGKFQSPDSLEQLREKEKKLKVEKERIHLEIGALQERLNRDRSFREKYREQMSNIEAREKECVRFGNLSELIGSADGKKFRNFAQGLTLDFLIEQANRQLRELSRRYLLVRGRDSLELDICDLDQAGEIRSTKNLSGGESFLVSLSLALGLSQMMSGKLKIESLFLDEGFGTLDEETLHTVLTALSQLQQQGKIIGIISHVEALKERISSRIELIPQPGGKSIIRGPGINRLSS